MYAQHQTLSHGIPKKYHVYLSTDSIYPPHWHEAIELVYALEGPIGIGINGKEMILEAGDIAVINSDVIHWFIQQPKPLKRWIIQIEASYFFSYSEYMAQKTFPDPILRKKDKDRTGPTHGVLEDSLVRLIGETKRKLPGYTIAMDGEIARIMVYLMRHMSHVEGKLPLEGKGGAGRKRLTEVLQYMEANFNKTIRLSHAAGVSHYSDYHFSRFFKESTGLTFCQYMNRLRISKASILLTSTDAPITDISYDTGFGSIKTFNRVFKQINGCSPSRYRKTGTSHPESAKEDSEA